MPLRIAFIAFLLTLFAAPGMAQRLPNFADIVEEASPAVVKINTISRGNATQLNIPDAEQIPEIFRYFFDPRNQPERESRSMGSGFVISSDGYLLTNNHVIEGATEIIVRMQDRREFTAELIGRDPRSDLALLKVDARGLPHLEFADPDKLRVGEWVLAIGSPFGLDFTASAGIVSAIGRSIPTENNENYVPFIQTDVAINPGNSGGPLFNMRGEVVGINSQIYTRSGGSIGLSFAIPAAVAINVVTQLKDKGRVDRGWLGVMIQEVDRDLADSFGLRKPEGALVARVEPDSPAARAGLRVGDIILSFNGNKILESGDLPHAVGSTLPESTVPVDLVREGKRKTVQVTVSTLGGEQPQASASPDVDGRSEGLLGLQVEPLPSDYGERFDVDQGVLVTLVDSSSPASRAGLQPGDVITQIGFKVVESVPQFEQVVAELPADSLLPIRFVRQGRPVFRTITTPE